MTQELWRSVDDYITIVPFDPVMQETLATREAAALPSISDPRIQGARRFNQLFASEPRLSATVIQTVGRKGYDGIVLATVIADASLR
jgi:hypothetical protein